MKDLCGLRAATGCFLFGVLFWIFFVPCQSHGQSAPIIKAPIEGVKEFLPGPPPSDAPPKSDMPDRSQKTHKSMGVPAENASGTVKNRQDNQTRAPKEMTVTGSPLPKEKIRTIEKNLPARFYPHEPRTLPTKQGEGSPADISQKKSKKEKHRDGIKKDYLPVEKRSESVPEQQD